MRNNPAPAKTRRVRGFTFIELLVVVIIIAVLASLVFGMTRFTSLSSKRAKCVANLRQIGTLIGVYASEHNGNWPCYIQTTSSGLLDNSTYSDSRNRYKGNVISAVGAIAPYTKDNRLFFCPADKRFYNAYQSRNFETEDAYGSYVTRGRNTIGSTVNPLGRKLSEVASYAIVSCWFLAIPDNANYPISHHIDHWPVLFGDGHVVVADKPDWLNSDHIPKVNDNPPNQIKFWRYFDTRR